MKLEAKGGFQATKKQPKYAPDVIPHYPPPGLTRAFDKGIDERPFFQGGAFDTAPFDVYWL